MGTGRRPCCRSLRTRCVGGIVFLPAPPSRVPGDHRLWFVLQDGLKPEGIDKDVWLHRKMKNNYLTEYDLSEFENIGAIGLELWQVAHFVLFASALGLYCRVWTLSGSSAQELLSSCGVWASRGGGVSCCGFRAPE